MAPACSSFRVEQHVAAMCAAACIGEAASLAQHQRERALHSAVQLRPRQHRRESEGTCAITHVSGMRWQIERGASVDSKRVWQCEL